MAVATQAAPISDSVKAPGSPALRADFPITGNGRTFLNSAYITPVPNQVVAATRAFIEAKASRPIEVRELLQGTERLRTRFAALINASADEVGLLFSTAEGENVVANGLDLKPGDNVVIDDLHYDTEYVLYARLARTKGIELRIARNRGGALDTSDFAPLIDAHTQLVSIAWVSHRNGFRHDVRALADLVHTRGALLYADAIQAVGAIKVDVRETGVDMLCAGGYKWLLGGWGVAPFYIRKDLISRLALDRYGEFHTKRELPDGDWEIDPTARRFDYSSRAFGEVHALCAGIDYIANIGVTAIEAHGVGLALELRQALARQGHRVATPPDNRSPIIAVACSHPAKTAQQAFDAARIDVTIRNGLIRIAPALFNTSEDIDRCRAVLKKLS